MFLSELNLEQKELFIQFCQYAANYNGIFANEEKAVIKEYCNEMGLDDSKTYEVNNDLDLLMKNFAEISTEREKKIVLFEILGLLMSDSIYDKEERKFTEIIATAFGIDDEEVKTIIRKLEDYKTVLGEIVEIINR